MAKNSGRHKPTEELKAEIARSRERVARDFRGVRYELDFPGKIRRSFRQQTAAWVTAAVVVGALVIVLPARKKKTSVDLKKGERDPKGKKILEAGFALGALRFAATLLKPVIISFITQKMRGYSGGGGAPRPGKW